jgi:hypothetical protein
MKSQLGIIERVRVARLVRKRHQNKHLDFDLVLLRTRRSGVRVPPGAPLFPGPARGGSVTYVRYKLSPMCRVAHQ